MRKILILCGRYLPGHRDGGPLRTIINITEALGDEYDFYIACLDRDHGDTEAYPNIKRDAWNSVGKAKVWYVAPGGFSDKLILELVSGKDCIYLSSFYDDYGYKTLLLKHKGKIEQPVYLASMGVFSDAALANKALKKKLFISACKCFGLFKNITWSVTSEFEAIDVKKHIGSNIKYVVAEDLPRSSIPGIKEKQHDILKIAFVSRICAHKNLDFAIRALESIHTPLRFTICGPVQEPEYWASCKKLLANAEFDWEYKGDIPSEKVQSVLADYDLLLFPSKSENYGHVVFEALSVGCLPFVSDKTPWQDLAEQNVGCNLQLQEELFTKAIEDYILLPDDEKNRLAENAVRYAEKKLADSVSNSGYRKIFG